MADGAISLERNLCRISYRNLFLRRKSILRLFFKVYQDSFYALFKCKHSIICFLPLTAGCCFVSMALANEIWPKPGIEFMFSP
jgi:hypothetical protein